MQLAVSIVVVLGVLALWRVAWRTRPILALGITLGILLIWVLAVVVDTPVFDKVPLWLPPLPFAVVATMLFVFGILAWVWGDDEDAPEASMRAPRDH